MAKKVVRLGMIGLGARSIYLAEHVFLLQEDVEIVAVCDLNRETMDKGVEKLMELGCKQEPKTFTNYHELLALPEVDAVVVITSWETHVQIACDCMRAGKIVAFEVGGASSLEECWKLVRTHEQTGVPCMFMENCCFGREEMMVLNMARNGLLGEIVHCRGGYHHDLRDLQTQDRESGKNFRFTNVTRRNCDSYPTHELGPIANVLNINRGNRMLSLVSMASKSAGLAAFIREKEPDNREPLPRFVQGDVVTTIIKCATGETITLCLDMSLPRYYSRGFCVRGTKGMYEGENRSLFLDGDDHDNWQNNYNNVEKYFEKYDHPLWKKYVEAGVKEGGHDGIDWLMGTAFIEAVREGKPMPIDAYDAAAWMSITCLSEQSIAMGGMPVAIPDFTCGNWMYRTPWEP